MCPWQGWTLLHYLALYSAGCDSLVGAIRSLIDRGLDPNTGGIQSPLKIARYENSSETVDAFLESNEIKIDDRELYPDFLIKDISRMLDLSPTSRDIIDTEYHRRFPES